MSGFTPIVFPNGDPMPWTDAAARAKGPFRPPPQRSALAAHEAGLVSDLEGELRDAVRRTVRDFVETRGLSGARARTAGLVGVAVECMALRAEAETRRKGTSNG